MLAIGQAASWDRSQDQQADFRAGVPVRVTAAGEGGLGATDRPRLDLESDHIGVWPDDSGER